MTQFNYTPHFKILLIGDEGTGKTTFLKRHLTGEFDIKYIATKADVLHTILQIETNRGPIQFEVCDTAGHHEFDVLDEGCYINAHGAILFFDITRITTYKNLALWYRDLLRNCGSIPTVLCGNKTDNFRPMKQASNFDFHRKMNLQVSLKNNSLSTFMKNSLYLFSGSHSVHSLVGEKKFKFWKTFPLAVTCAYRRSQAYFCGTTTSSDAPIFTGRTMVRKSTVGFIEC